MIDTASTSRLCISYKMAIPRIINEGKMPPGMDDAQRRRPVSATGQRSGPPLLKDRSKVSLAQLTPQVRRFLPYLGRTGSTSSFSLAFAPPLGYDRVEEDAGRLRRTSRRRGPQQDGQRGEVARGEGARARAAASTYSVRCVAVMPLENTTVLRNVSRLRPLSDDFSRKEALQGSLARGVVVFSYSFLAPRCI